MIISDNLFGYSECKKSDIVIIGYSDILDIVITLGAEIFGLNYHYIQYIQ